jgi:protein-tyrosine-phosphatase
MAEALLKSELKRLKISGITVSSAGLRGGGKSINFNAAKTLSYKGLELNNFTSKLISETTFSALAIIAMTQEICDELKKIQRFGLETGKLKEKKDNIFSFKELVGYDVPDPYGYGEREYAIAFSQIEGGMSAIIERFAAQIAIPTGEQPVEKDEEPVVTKTVKEKPKTQRKPRVTKPKTATKSTPTTKKSASATKSTKTTKSTAKKSASKTSSKSVTSATGTKKKTTPKKSVQTAKKTVKTTKTTTKKSVEKPKK